MDIQSVIVVGLASGFLTYLLVESPAVPRFWNVFINWWRRIAFNGKPFTCNLCMSFWLSALVYFVSHLQLLKWYRLFDIGVWINEVGSILVSIFASACIALLIDKVFNRLDTTILISK